MNIERQYIRQFLNESKKQSRKFEDSGYKYAYTTRSRAEDGGWAVADSPEELREDWDKVYGSFNSKRILVMKPATSVDKAMVISSEPNLGDIIYPSIDAAINGPLGLRELGWEEGEGLSDATEEDIKELLQTKDLKIAEEILGNIFVDEQDFGYFKGLYEYVSGPIPASDGVNPRKIVVPTNIDLEKQVRDFDYYLKWVKNKPTFFERVPARFKTPELCKIAVENTDWSLEYVPDKLKTPELCKIAVEGHGVLLKYVPNKLKTLELCKIAVEKDSHALEYVPANLKEQVKRELGLS